MIPKKMLGTAIVCAMLLNSTMVVPFATTAADTKYEFEDGTLSGNAVVKSEDTGYSGSGYVFLEKEGDSASVTMDVPEEGMYTLKIGYEGAFGAKNQNLEINGVSQGTLQFDEGKTFAEVEYGPVKLAAGENTVTIVGSWGWMNLDYVSIAAAEAVELKCSNTPCDPKASAEVQGLMNYLATVYGEYVVSGQQEIYGGGNNGNYEHEMEYIYEATGKYPAIRGFDFMNMTNPCYGWDDKTTDRAIEWVNTKGGIATASWHITVPKDFASYSIGDKLDWSVMTYNTQTDFSPTNVVNDPDSKDYQYFRLCVENLAKELTKLQDAGVPIILRPFHEAEGAGGETGSWFWWGKDGSATYKALWKLLYTTLTEEFGLHNIIWEFNSYTYKNSRNWYPGDDYVDLVGYDKYNASAGSPNESAISSTFYNLVDMYSGAGKMISMSECDTIPSVKNMQSENAYWLYFCPWYEDSNGEDSSKFLSKFNDAQTLKTIYQSDLVVTLDELPDYKTYEYTGEPFVPPVTEPTDPPAPTEPPTEPEEGHAKLVQEDGYIAVQFPEAVGDTCYLKVELADGITYANGGLGASVEVDGEYYWVNTQWEATKSGTVKVDMTKPLNVTLGTEEVTDEAIIAAAIAEVQKQKNFQGQVWYTGNADEEPGALTDAKIVDAYLASASEPTTDPTEDPTKETVAQEFVYGDCNDSGNVEIGDVIALCRAASGSYTLSETGGKAADVDLNGKVDTTDASYILQNIVKLIELPYTGE